MDLLFAISCVTCINLANVPSVYYFGPREKANRYAPVEILKSVLEFTSYALFPSTGEFVSAVCLSFHRCCYLFVPFRLPSVGVLGLVYSNEI